jgi:transposase
MRDDIALVDGQIEQLLADSAGQILTTLPGVLTTRAAAFAAHTLPVERFATPANLYSATGLAPASYQSSTVRRRGGISRTGFAPAFQQRLSELRARGKTPLEARVALARHACRLALANTAHPRALRRSASRSRQARPRAVTASELCRTTAQPSLPPARARRSSRRKRKPAARRRLISLPT